MKDLTRREAVKGLAGILAACTPPALLAGTRVLSRTENLPCEAHNAGLLRGVGARNAMMGGGVTLPYDEEVDYLESKGSEYIDPEVTLVGPTPRVTFDMQMMADEDRDQIGTDGGQIFRINFNGGATCYYRYGDGSSRTWNGYINILALHSFDIGAKCFIDGVLKYEASPVPQFANSARIYLFKGRNYSKIRLNNVKIFQGDGSLLRDFIAVKKDNVGYFYDKAHTSDGPLGNGLFGNAGSGYFDFPGRLA